MRFQKMRGPVGAVSQPHRIGQILPRASCAKFA